jgi:hypothetical protein
MVIPNSVFELLNDELFNQLTPTVLLGFDQYLVIQVYLAFQ